MTNFSYLPNKISRYCIYDMNRKSRDGRHAVKNFINNTYIKLSKFSCMENDMISHNQIRK